MVVANTHYPDNAYQVSLKQCHAHLVQLRHLWTSPLLPTTLLGTPNYVPDSIITPSVCVDVTTFTDIEDPKKDRSNTDSNVASQETPQAALDLEPEEVLICDIIEVDDDDVAEITNIVDTTQLDIQSDAADFIWELPVRLTLLTFSSTHRSPKDVDKCRLWGAGVPGCHLWRTSGPL